MSCLALRAGEASGTQEPIAGELLRRGSHDLGCVTDSLT